MTIIFNTKLGEIIGITSSSKIQITVFKSSLSVPARPSWVHWASLGFASGGNRQPPNLWVNMSML